MTAQDARIKAMLDAVGADFKLNTRPILFSASGALTTRTGKSRIVLLGSGLIVAVRGYLDTPATGATTFKVDVDLNGTTIYGTTHTNQPTWTASANTPTVGSHSVTTYADGDQLSCDIDAVGSTVAGSDLTMTIYLLRTS